MATDVCCLFSPVEMGAPELELLTHVNLSRVSVSFGATAAVCCTKIGRKFYFQLTPKIRICVCVSLFFLPQKN